MANVHKLMAAQTDGGDGAAQTRPVALGGAQIERLQRALEDAFNLDGQAAIFGGTAGIALEPCYHQACDTYANNDDTALDEMSDATAHAVLTFAMTTSAVNGTDKGKSGGASQFEYQGSLLKK